MTSVPLIQWRKKCGPLYLIDQWSAGTHSIRIVVRALMDGDHAGKLPRFIRLFRQSDFIQTEHFCILRAMKRMERGGGPLSLERLLGEIALMDCHGWVTHLIMPGMIKSRRADKRWGPNLVETASVLRRLRRERAEETSLQRLGYAGIARRVLDRSMSMFEGARHLEGVEYEVSNGREVFGVFIDFLLDMQHQPREDQRPHWEDRALARKDAERAETESRRWPEFERACRALIERWGVLGGAGLHTSSS